MSASLPILRLAEWEAARRAPVAELAEPDRQLALALREADGGRLLVDERRDGVWVSARSWVGVVRFSAFEVRVVPKLAGGNLGVVRMLDYALGVGALRRYESVRTLEAVGDSLLELIAWLLGIACEKLVRDGLLSDYVAREDTLHVLRGRLRLKDQASRRYLQVDPLEVAFDDYETDIPDNRVLTAALAATRGVVRSPVVQRLIRREHAIFMEACPSATPDPLGLFDEISYSRRNEHYRYAHLLARLLLSRLAVRDLFTPGGTTSFAFLIDMNELFEAFVTRLAEETLGKVGMRVRAQRRDPSIILDDATGNATERSSPICWSRRPAAGSASASPSTPSTSYTTIARSTRQTSIRRSSMAMPTRPTFAGPERHEPSSCIREPAPGPTSP